MVGHPVVDDPVIRNRQVQAELYGEPLGDRFRRVMDALDLTQARVAEVVGLSPAMLSQLMGARRIKIGHPAVVQRMQALEDEALAAEACGVPPDLDDRLGSIRDAAPATTRASQSTPPPVAATSDPDAAAVVQGIQDVLRAAASATEMLDAAALLEADHPGLAQVLRVYGTGRTADAVAFHRHHD